MKSIKLKIIKKKFVPQINIRKLTKKIKSNLDLSLLTLKKNKKKNKKIKNTKTSAQIKALKKQREQILKQKKKRTAR
jgi:hypothetical protein